MKLHHIISSITAIQDNGLRASKIVSNSAFTDHHYAQKQTVIIGCVLFLNIFLHNFNSLYGQFRLGNKVSILTRHDYTVFFYTVTSLFNAVGPFIHKLAYSSREDLWFVFKPLLLLTGVSLWNIDDLINHPGAAQTVESWRERDLDCRQGDSVP